MLKKIILLVGLIIIGFNFTGCSSLGEWVKEVSEPKSKVDEVHEHHRPLESQRLIPRPGYEGKLTNRVCLKFYGDKCEQESVREYDLADEKIRKRLIDLQFACHIGGKRFRICPDKAGYCRREQHKVCARWGKTLFRRKKVCREWKTDVKLKFISVEEHQFLLDSRTECKKGL